MAHVQIGSTVRLKIHANTHMASRRFRVKCVEDARLTIEGCSIGYPCVSRSSPISMDGCNGYLYGDWESQIEVDVFPLVDKNRPHPRDLARHFRARVESNGIIWDERLNRHVELLIQVIGADIDLEYALAELKKQERANPPPIPSKPVGN